MEITLEKRLEVVGIDIIDKSDNEHFSIIEFPVQILRGSPKTISITVVNLKKLILFILKTLIFTFAYAL